MKEPKIIFNITPCTAPRMTKRDTIFLDPYHKDPRKRQRACVTQYFEYKNNINSLCVSSNFQLPAILDICFVIPMADTWSDKKKLEYHNKPHQQTPDIDNLLKAFMDSFKNNDSYVWAVKSIKIWGQTGQIIIY